ncbi:hypothetical protein J4E91_003735 [Alternaria rosae]|nr:hypothetical protein J4E91_003735 [Alternaria rosae]
MLSWIFEILALIASIASISAIVIILIGQNNKPITAWTFIFTLNTWVAALGTVARTTLAFAMSACVGQQKWSWLRRRSDSVLAFERFDEASRGPWGGSRLFVWLRFRHWAALGALVTVGTVAFDPFFQAVISTYGKLDDIAVGSNAIDIGSLSNATIGRALRVDGGYIIENPGGPVGASRTPSGILQYTYTESRPDFGIVSSVNAGFYNASTNTPNAVAFTCATGNCTWPAFVSAAVCSSCKDVSDTLVFNGTQGSNGSNIPGPTNIHFDGPYSVFSLPETEIKNFNGLSKVDDDDWYKYTTGAESGVPRTFMTVKTGSTARQTLKHSDVQTLMMSFKIIRAADDWVKSKVPWESSHPVATECALYFCSNIYQASSRNGLVEENVTGSWAVRDPGSHKIYKTLGSLDSEDEKYIDSTGYDLYNPTIDFPRHDLRLLIPPEQAGGFSLMAAQEVNISHALLRSTIDYLHVFTSYAAKFSGDPPPSLIAFPDRDAPAFVDALWKSTNLTTTFENVARSLTNQMRNTSPNRLEGVTQRWVTHVRVDWAYMGFPAGMLLIGITYVILVIFESARLRIPVWKESALPILMYGFDNETQRLLGERAHYKEDKKVKTSVRYDLDEQEDCLRLMAD